jgi:polar amino acid transport system substrate-binding protein
LIYLLYLKFFLLVLAILFSFGSRLYADDLVASLALIPMHSQIGKSGQPEGGFVRVAKAIDDVYKNGEISIGQYPFSRSLDNVVSGKADFHMPLIRIPHVPEDSLPFAYAKERITQVTFVLYTRADSPPLDKNELNQHVVETIRGHKQLFLFKTAELSSIDQGIKKLLHGRSDAFIMEQDAVDSYIRKQKFKNIRRTFFASWDTCVVIPKGPKQQEIDQIVSTALRRLKASGELQAIVKSIHQPYEVWQPYKMTSWK